MEGGLAHPPARLLRVPEALPAMVAEPGRTVAVDGGVVTVLPKCVAPGEVRELILHP